MERAPAQCVICESSDRKPLIRLGEWTIQQCQGCGVGILDPRPSELELTDLYQNNYFDSQYDTGLQRNSQGMKRRVSQEDHRIRFFRKFKRKGTVLDIGCGMGYFLHACRLAGYDVEGTDISNYAAAYVSSQLGISVTTGPLETIEYPPSSIDVITMWHFLEHTPDPASYLKKAYRWLTDDGLLVVDVPNYVGTDAQKNWEKWVGWQIPYHLYHYTPSSLRHLLKKHGFIVIRSKDYHSEYIKDRLKKIPVVNIIARLIAKCYSGTSYAVVAKKSGKGDVPND